LSAFTGQAARRIAIAAGEGGKPELADNPDGLHFNASRSKDFALIALGRAPLGVDIEAVRPEFSWRTIAMHWFHPREQALLASAPEARRSEIFFQIWTHKEAYCKGVGTGLDREAMIGSFTGPESRSVRGAKGSQATQWRLKALAAPRGYKASLASANVPPIVVDRTASFAEASRLQS
jgi:4'-phosphopantetheinyl transferase